MLSEASMQCGKLQVDSSSYAQLGHLHYYYESGTANAMWSDFCF